MTRWYQEKKREGYYKQAKREGYRARSAYKLKQIDDKYRVVYKGDTVVDLGSSPGGWTQVAVELAGPKGFVVGIDLAHTPPIDGAILLQGDMTKEETRERVKGILSDHERVVNLVVSDMSPNISGNYDRDQAESVWLAQHALEFARLMLDRGGRFVCKVFEGQDFQEFMTAVRASFERVKLFHPPASRKRSSEVYVIAHGFRGASSPNPSEP